MRWSHCRSWSGTATDHVSARETLQGHSSLRFWRHDTAGRTWEGPRIRQPRDRRRAQLQTQAWTWRCRRTNLVTPCRRGCIHWSAHRGSRWRWPEILALQWRGVRHCERSVNADVCTLRRGRANPRAPNGGCIAWRAHRSSWPQRLNTRRCIVRHCRS